MFDEQLANEIRECLAQGRKIDAVKRVREVTGWGLKEAKDAVEAVEYGGELPSFSPVETGDLGSQVLPLLQAGKKIDAIKAYREQTGAGLQDAKEAVEAIAVRHGIAARAGCAGALLILAGLAGLATLAAAAIAQAGRF